MTKSQTVSAGTTVLYGIEHLLTDFMCHFFMFRFVYGVVSSETCVVLFILYNFLAFALQCPLGYFCDKLRPKISVGISYGLILFVYILVFFGIIDPGRVVFDNSLVAEIEIIAGVVILGVANSMFHAGGCKGVMCPGERGLKNGGVFIAFGALGVGFGDFCGKFAIITPVWIVCVLSLVIIEIAIMDAVSETRKKKKGEEAAPEKDPTAKAPLSVAVLILCLIAVLARSYGGFCMPGGFTKLYNPFVGTPLEALSKAMPSSVLGFVGKLLGGFLVVWSVKLFKSKTDLRIANLRYGTTALILSAILCGFFGGYAVPCAIGIILFHSVMPVTLYEIYIMLSDYPGFALGLTTLMLFIGILPNYVFTPAGTAKTVAFVVTTLVAAGCLLACVFINRKQTTEEAA